VDWFPVGYSPSGSNEDYIINHLKFKVLVHPYQAQGDVVVTSEDGVAMVESDRKSGFQIVEFEVVPCSVRRDPEAISKLKMYEKADSVNCPLDLEKSQVIRRDGSSDSGFR
jgi:transmembrane 9 superfamily member 2/4